MDFDNIQQNMNTRVVFKEPRGMVRWLQLLFAVIAFTTVVDFNTNIGMDIKCPTPVTPAPTPAPSPPPGPNPAPAPAPIPVPTPVTPVTESHPKLVITYPFDFSKQMVNNTCPGAQYSYIHQTSLDGSPQFFVMIGILSLMYAAISLVGYLLFSDSYSSIPAVPMADLLVTAVLCISWLLASSIFSSGASLLKSTINYNNLKQTICPGAFENQVGAACTPSITDILSWKSINVALVAGFTSSFLWGAGMWFVFKETDLKHRLSDRQLAMANKVVVMNRNEAMRQAAIP